MEQNRFFKFLWRANAIFLFTAGIGLIGLLFMAFSFVISDLRSSDTPPPAVTIEQNQEEETFEIRASGKYNIGYNIGEVENFTYFELRAGVDSYGKLSSGSSSQRRNIAVYDLDEDTTYWVFPDARQEIERFESIRKETQLDDKNSKIVTTGFVLTVAKTLADGTISRDLWVMTPNGKGLRKILSDITDAPDIKSYGEGQTKLIVETKTHIDVYPFDVDNLTIGVPTRVSIP